MDNINFAKCKKCNCYRIEGDSCKCDENWIPSKEYLREQVEILNEIEEIQRSVITSIDSQFKYRGIGVNPAIVICSYSQMKIK